MKALILIGSPRRDGNSAALAQAVKKGLIEAGHETRFIFADDAVAGFLRDCRQCRRADGECGIEDGFRATFLEDFLPADGFIVATPVYWYGMSAQLKAFFDRMFCYVAASHPQSSLVVEQMTGKRIGLLLSSEETFPTVAAGIVHQLQEYSRYTRSTFAGTVHGYGNARGDLGRDPHRPLASAEQFGRDFFTRHATDYQIDTPRPGRVWGECTTA
ncbi:NADPH-dependent FMN reductase [Parvibaculum lavamentivorans DS-1]|uniref:NADPH-dependent FMN reductase n=1 Tax=Parvibaculum lavamentivorans (strain DS-1 / DSM 13023 / NCIMB 13966) TaxID=402881 RepID=A7HTM2_PARL1|nr:flavodoxin family protein [Parvibaculum lavamentivorans]ABS63255.1 NADPH-dependent FMN reductase [Parvibaculum lavamentivorans DS-1]